MSEATVCSRCGSKIDAANPAQTIAACSVGGWMYVVTATDNVDGEGNKGTLCRHCFLHGVMELYDAVFASERRELCVESGGA